MNAIVNEMDNLRQGLEAEAYGIASELSAFPSGSAMLDIRRNGRAFVMAYTPDHGFGVDELFENDGFVTGYHFVSKEFEPAARQMRVLVHSRFPTSAPMPAMSLMVLQSSNVDASRDFYSLIGLSFVEERHGSGPRHFSASIGELVLEIYPCQGSNPPAPLRLGFRIPSLDQTLETLRKRGTRIISEAKDSPWGRRSVVEDPDGNRVELTLADK